MNTYSFTILHLVAYLPNALFEDIFLVSILSWQQCTDIRQIVITIQPLFVTKQIIRCVRKQVGSDFSTRATWIGA